MEEPRFVALSVLLALVWGGTALAWLLHAAKDRARRVSTLVMVGFALAFGPFAFSKNGGDPPLRSGASAPSAPSVSLLLAEVRTNAVFDLSMPSNAVVHGPWLRRGASDDWFWLHATNALFRAGTNAFRSVRVSSRGTLAFPDGSRLEPFHAVLGVLPEPNWTNAPSCVWQATAAGGGRLFTWEGAALDRDPATPVSFQAELRRDGGVVGRYDLPHPATNFTLAAFGETALAVRGGVTNAATVRRVDGEPVPETSLAELLRDARRFELVWRAAEGDPDADPDGDGLTTRDEIGRHGTDPKQADTDGDGLSDASELLLGSNPLDADENGDGVPDGVDPADWAAHALWAANGTNGVVVTVSLNTAIPAEASATFLLDDLAVPLRAPGSWSFAFVPGIAYDYRLFVTDGATADLSITTAPPEPTRGVPLRSGTDDENEPLWNEGDGDVFDGPSGGGGGKIAVPTIQFTWNALGGGGHFRGGGLCLHAANAVDLTPSVLPSEIGAEWVLENLEDLGDGSLRLSLPEAGTERTGTATLAGELLREGSLAFSFTAHRCDAGPSVPFCSVCGCYDPQDAVLDALPRMLTLKHDNRLVLSLSHPQSPDIAYSDVRFEIRRSDDAAWTPVTGNVWTARIAGTFLVRGFAQAGGRGVAVGPLTVWVQFPSESEMMADPVVQTHATNLWSQTLALCTETNRHEVGCWILLDTATDTYTFTATTNGPPTTNYEDSEIDLLPLPPDSPAHPTLAAGSAVYAVASLHTHTPTTYVVGDPRKVGPSQADLEASSTLLMPGLVYDFEECGSDPGTIPIGHPKNGDARLYPTTIQPRRTRP